MIKLILQCLLNLVYLKDSLSLYFYNIYIIISTDCDKVSYSIYRLRTFQLNIFVYLTSIFCSELIFKLYFSDDEL